jgi:cysteine synthase
MMKLSKLVMKLLWILSRKVAKEEGILGGISSGAAIYAAIRKS